MQYLHKLYFLDSQKTNVKLELYISYLSIDYMTWHKREITEGTTLHTNINSGVIRINHIIEGLPENVNQIAFDGDFLKSTGHYSGGDGAMKKYSVWINTDNIAMMYMGQPDSTVIYFRSGNLLTVANKLSELMKNLLEHNDKMKQRRKAKYGK